MVRTFNAIALLSFGALVGACRGDGGTTAANDGLKHDLDLAASSATTLASEQPAGAFLPADTMPPSAVREPNVREPNVRRGAGSKVVRSSTPTVRAAPTPRVAESTGADPTVLAPAPVTVAPTPVTVASAAAEGDESIPAVPRPVPTAIPDFDPSPSANGTGTPNGSSQGEGIGSVIAGILGAVIRGGQAAGSGITIGDGDRCELHQPGRGRNRAQPRGGGVYSPGPMGPAGVMGGRIYVRPRFTPR